jgi:DNA invertase Pin-like site-specific DNA recombinase
LAHRVGAYVRISEDLDGAGLGVARQERDCRQRASRRGWAVAEVFRDNDVSAYKARVVRPEFERLLAELEAGRLDGVVVYDLDRFARKPSDLERAISIFDARPGLGFATVQSDIDLSTPDGRTMARVLVAFANKASMDTSRRVKRKHLELAQRGVPVGGSRPFGWQDDHRTLDDAEASLLRQAAADVLAGVGLHTICRRWNEAGVTTPRENHWRRGVLKNVLLSPRLAGLRVHQGRVAVDEDGQPVRGQYEPVLDSETWEAVGAVLRDNARGGGTHVGGRKYLLTGVVRCSVCYHCLFGNGDTRNRGNFYYGCKPTTSGGGCGRVAISGAGLDGLVTDLVLSYLADREVERDAEPWLGEAELHDVTRRIKELMDAFARRELSSDVVFPAVAKLESEAAGLREARASWVSAQALTAHRPADVGAAWPDLTVEQRRGVIESVLSAVVVRPATTKGNRMDPGRVEVVWR